ncbi:MAG: hypothetical protein EBS48_06390, partial [Actinobacteria bacterium]|nr:hypothetical protein [Actinomycetota bacterium]
MALLTSATLVIGTFVTATATGAQAAVASLDDYAQPLFARTSVEQVVSESDGSSADNGFGPVGTLTDMAMLQDRRLVATAPTGIIVMTADGSPDVSFGTNGWVGGLIDVTSLAVDETAGRIYVLDSG